MILRKRSSQSGALSGNLILAIVLIVIGSFAYWYEFKKKPEIALNTDSKRQLLSLDMKQELESVKIVDSDKGLNIEMRCTSACKLNDSTAQWQITSPIAFKADEGNVGTFVSSMASAAIQETIPLEGDTEAKLKEFGLGVHRRETNKVVIKFKGLEPYSIYVGDNAAVGDGVYTYVSGPNQNEKVVRIVPGFVKTNAQRNLSYWRTKRLFEFAASEVDSFSITNNSGTFQLTRENGNWYLPGKVMADNEAVDTFITGLVFLNAQEFVSDDKVKDRAKLKLPAKPHYTVSVKAAKRPEAKLQVFDVLQGSQPKILATLADKNFVVELERTAVDKFGKKAESFRFRNLVTPAEREQIAQIDLTLGKKDKFTFKKDAKDNWALTSGKIDNFDPAAVGSVLVKVGIARIADYLGKKPVPAGNTELSSWIFTGKDGKVLRSFTIYGSKDRKGDNFVKLPSAEIAMFEKGSGSAVPFDIAEFQKEQVPTPAPTKK